MRYLLAALLLCAPGLAFAQDPPVPDELPSDGEDCVTQPENFWICEGDGAWSTGYLIPPSVLDLRECMVWEEKAGLLPECLKQRDAFRGQRNKALQEVTRLEGLYDEAVAYGDDYRTRYDGCADDLDERYELWEVAVIGGGTGLGAILIGIVIGALAL